MAVRLLRLNQVQTELLKPSFVTQQFKFTYFSILLKVHIILKANLLFDVKCFPKTIQTLEIENKFTYKQQDFIKLNRLGRHFYNRGK